MGRRYRPSHHGRRDSLLRWCVFRSLHDESSMRKSLRRTNGYMAVHFPSHPKADVNGYMSEHVLIAETILGKLLPKGAVIHHVNQNKADNRPANLVICENDQYHRLLHVRTRIVKRGGKPSMHKVCPVCDTLRQHHEFPVNRRNLYNLNWECRSCATARANAWRNNQKTA